MTSEDMNTNDNNIRNIAQEIGDGISPQPKKEYVAVIDVVATKPYLEEITAAAVKETERIFKEKMQAISAMKKKMAKTERYMLRPKLTGHGRVRSSSGIGVIERPVFGKEVLKPITDDRKVNREFYKKLQPIPEANVIKVQPLEAASNVAKPSTNAKDADTDLEVFELDNDKLFDPSSIEKVKEVAKIKREAFLNNKKKISNKNKNIANKRNMFQSFMKMVYCGYAKTPD